MARRATVIKDFRAKTSNLLVLDAGDALFGQPASNASEGKALTEAMGLMKYNGMAIGERDMAHFASLLARSREAAFPFLSANLVYTSTGRPVFTPYVVQDMGGHKVAVIGLSPADESFKAQAPADVNATDPIEAARQYVAKARGEKVDAIIVLSHLGNALDRQLAAGVEGITAIIGGHSYELLQDPVVVGSTYIAQAGYNGEWLGALTLDLDSTGKATGAKVNVISLTDEYASDPELAALADKYNAAQ